MLTQNQNDVTYCLDFETHEQLKDAMADIKVIGQGVAHYCFIVRPEVTSLTLSVQGKAKVQYSLLEILEDTLPVFTYRSRRKTLYDIQTRRSLSHLLPM